MEPRRRPGSPRQSFTGRVVDPTSDAIAAGSVPESKGYDNISWEDGPWEAGFTVNSTDPIRDDQNFCSIPPIDAVTGLGKKRFMENWCTLEAPVSSTCKSDNRYLDHTSVKFTALNFTDTPPLCSAGAFNDNFDTSLYNISAARSSPST